MDAKEVLSKLGIKVRYCADAMSRVEISGLDFPSGHWCKLSNTDYDDRKIQRRAREELKVKVTLREIGASIRELAFK